MGDSNDASPWIPIEVPEFGADVDYIRIGRWFVRPGEQVAADQSIVEIETDKVNAELSAPTDGYLAGRVFEKGDFLETGTVIGLLSERLHWDTGQLATEVASIRQRTPEPRLPRVDPDADVVDSSTKEPPSALRLLGEGIVTLAVLYLAMESDNLALIVVVAFGLTLRSLTNR